MFHLCAHLAPNMIISRSFPAGNSLAVFPILSSSSSSGYLIIIIPVN